MPDTVEKLRALVRPRWVLAIAAALYAIATVVANGEWLSGSVPASGVLPQCSMFESNIAFIAASALIVFLTRRFGRHELVEWLHALFGLIWLTAICGWHNTVGLTLIAVVVFAAGRYVPPHFAMVGAAALILVGVRFWFTAPVPGTYQFALACLRVTYYAFEQKSIRRSRRRLATFLAYGPLSLLLWPGPVQLSYLTFTTERPRQELDRLASQQLLHGTVKLVLFATALRVVQGIDVEHFVELPFPQQMGVFVLPYLLFFFRLSIRQDIGAAMSNFAGYYAPSAFRLPLLSAGPFELWRRWNVHVVDFIRRAFSYQLARWLRGGRSLKLTSAVFGGLAGTILFHMFLKLVCDGPDMKIVEAFNHARRYVWAAAILVVFIPIELVRPRLHRGWRAILIIATQLFAIVVCFSSDHLANQYFGKPLPAPWHELLVQSFYRLLGR